MRNTAIDLASALVASAFLAMSTAAAAQEGATGSIRVHPNLATQSREGFTVCAGTPLNRAQYGSKVTGSTGIVTFPGIPAGTSVVTTVSKGGFTGREQGWVAPASGSTHDVIIYMFTGSGGSTCPTSTAVSAPAPPPAASSVGITVDPGASLGRGGFYVCVGTSQNRAAYGNGITSPSSPLSFANLPGTGMIKATVMRAGYVGVERDWYPNPGQSVTLTLPVVAGGGGFTCPGYAAPYAKDIRSATVTMAPQQGEVGVQVPIAPAARVFDQYNNAMAGATVSFVVTQGGGTVTPSSIATDADGIARSASWLLGPSAGANEVAATVQGASLRLLFSATGVVLPKSLEAVSATTQQGLTGTAAPQPPAVVVRDRNGTAIPGASVTFTASAAGGSVSPATVTSGSDGIARLTRWTLGPNVGTNTVLASAGALRVLFTAAVLAPAPVSLTLPAAPQPSLAELSARVTQSANPITAGAEQTYTVRVHNRGAGTATAAVVRSTLPNDLVFSSFRADHGFVCSRSGTTVNCVSGTIQPGDSATIRIVMSLAVTAQSGHEILFNTKVDPDNAVTESNETNNHAAAATTTKAAVAALVDYRITSLNELVELFQLAKANGFEFVANSSDMKDILGKPISCWIGMGTMNGTRPIMGALSGAPPLGTEFQCFFEFFGRTRKLAPGWQLRSTEWTSPSAFSSAYVEPPRPESGSAYFSRLVKWSFPLTTSGRQWVTAVTLRGPVAANWRDAFR